METAAAKIARLDRSIARTGETVTLRRTTVDASGAVDLVAELTLPAHIRATLPQDLLAPGVVECRIVVSATQLLINGTGLFVYRITEDGQMRVTEDDMQRILEGDSFGIPLTDDRILIHGDAQNLQTIAPIYYGGQLVRVNLLSRG